MSYDTSSRIYVGNLPYNTTGEDLEEAFSKCGQVTDGKNCSDLSILCMSKNNFGILYKRKLKLDCVGVCTW